MSDPSPMPRRPRHLVALLSAALLLLPVGASPADAAGPTCITSGTTSVVQLCITAPSDGSVVVGNVTATATATVLSGSASVQRMIFSLDGAYMLTDYQAPYTFTLPSAKFVDGSHAFSVAALLRDGTTTSSAVVHLTFSNGVTVPPPGNTTPWTPTSGTRPGFGQPFVVAAVGDGASGDTTNVSVANLVTGWNPNLFLYLGDVYEKGAPVEFFNWYASTYGNARLRAVTDPVIGNHEYSNSSKGAGYFGYWGPGSDTYSFEAGGWHFIALNANSQLSTSQWQAQLAWLSSDLSAHPGACTIAYWHQPLYNIGPEGATTRTQDFWNLLVPAHATLVLNGHDHDYQRWTALDASGSPSSSGVTEVIAGGGGHAAQTITGSDPRVVKSVGGAASYGALKLSLSSRTVGLQYLDKTGKVLDSANLPCQGTPPTPGSISGTVHDAGTGLPIAGASVSTTGASTTTDANGGYTLGGLYAGTYPVTVTATGYGSQTASATVVNGQATPLDFQLTAPGAISGTVTNSVTGLPIAGAGVSTTGASTTTDATGSYTLGGLTAGGYTVTATASGYAGESLPVTVTAGGTAPLSFALAPATIFSDGFEAGSMSAWTTNAGITVQSAIVHTGSWAAEASTATGGVYARKTLPATQADLYYRVYFYVRALPATGQTANLIGDRTAAGGSITRVYIDASGRLGLRNDIAASSSTNPTAVSVGTWHSLELHVMINGTSSVTEGWLDGVAIPAFANTTANLGTTPVGAIQLGENQTGRSYDIVYDDLVTAVARIGP